MVDIPLLAAGELATAAAGLVAGVVAPVEADEAAAPVDAGVEEDPPFKQLYEE